jgi:hypothetical protein
MNIGYLLVPQFLPGGLIWYTDGTRMAGGSGAGVCGVILKRKLSSSLGVCVTVFQSEFFVILAFAKDLKGTIHESKFIYAGIARQLCEHLRHQG